MIASDRVALAIGGRLPKAVRLLINALLYIGLATGFALNVHTPFRSSVDAWLQARMGANGLLITQNFVLAYIALTALWVSYVGLSRRRDELLGKAMPQPVIRRKIF